MWRLIIILVLACANASGQGKITFGNDSNHLFVLGYPWLSDPTGPIPSSPLPSGLSLVAVLYAGTSAGILSLQTSVVLSGANWLSPGRMANQAVILTVPGGSPRYFQIFVMDTAATRPSTILGGSGRQSFPGATYIGTSGLFTAVPGTSFSYPHIAASATSSTWANAPLDAAPCLECHPPTFTKNPSNAWASVGNNVTLSATASHYVPSPIFYQWRKQFIPIAGATTNYLTLTNVTLSDAGNYDIIASNEFGNTLSAVAKVTVLVPALLGSPSYNANNQFQFTVTGAPGTNYIVQVSTNLLSSEWAPIFTNPSPFIFTDSNSTGIPNRFYRASSP